MQLTERCIYFTWENLGLREVITLFRDTENAQELPPPTLRMILDHLQLRATEMFGEYTLHKIKSVSLSADSATLRSFVLRPV
jgi:hypothetical protein